MSGSFGKAFPGEHRELVLLSIAHVSISNIMKMANMVLPLPALALIKT
jgi:hypothetical protein